MTHEKLLPLSTTIYSPRDDSDFCCHSIDGPHPNCGYSKFPVV